MSIEDDERLPGYHERVRRRGIQPLVYRAFRAIAQPSITIWFRQRRRGHHHIPPPRDRAGTDVERHTA